MKKRLTCLTAIFLTQLAGEIGLSQSVQARPYQESESIPKFDSYLTAQDDSRSEVSEVLGACWTLGATNPKGYDQSAKWADAHNQLRLKFRRDMNFKKYPVTGYCKGHTKGFKFRTADVATDRKPGSSAGNLVGSNMRDRRFICAQFSHSYQACLTRREWVSFLNGLLSKGIYGGRPLDSKDIVSIKVPNYGTYAKTMHAWISTFETHSFSSAKISGSRVPIRHCKLGHIMNGVCPRFPN